MESWLKSGFQLAPRVCGHTWWSFPQALAVGVRSLIGCLACGVEATVVGKVKSVCGSLWNFPLSPPTKYKSKAKSNPGSEMVKIPATVNYLTYVVSRIWLLQIFLSLTRASFLVLVKSFSHASHSCFFMFTRLIRMKLSHHVKWKGWAVILKHDVILISALAASLGSSHSPFDT